MAEGLHFCVIHSFDEVVFIFGVVFFFGLSLFLGLFSFLALPLFLRSSLFMGMSLFFGCLHIWVVFLLRGFLIFDVAFFLGLS